MQVSRVVGSQSLGRVQAARGLRAVGKERTSCWGNKDLEMAGSRVSEVLRLGQFTL